MTSRRKARYPGTAGWLLLAMVASTQRAEARELEEYSWIEVRNDRFTFYSALSERNTKRLLDSLEALRIAVPVVSSIDRTESAVPTKIFAIRRASDFEKLGIDTDLAGLFLGDFRGNTILIRDTPNMDEAAIVLHEYAHFLTFNAAEFAFPRWFQEGFAEYLSTTRVHGDDIDVGRPAERRLADLRYRRWIPSESLLETDAFDSLRDDGKSMFYAQAWLLVHYLVNRRNDEFDFGDAMREHLDLVAAGTGEVPAFEQSMGIASDDLSRVLRNYADDCCKYLRLSGLRDPDAGEPFVREVSREEIAEQLGRVALDLENTEAAARWFSIAATDESFRARAEAGLAALAELAGDDAVAREHYDTAVSLAPDDAFVHIQQAFFRIQQAGSASNPELRIERLKRARESLLAAWKLNDSLPEIYYANGLTYLMQRSEPAKAVDMLEEAAFLNPSSLQIQATLAVAYLSAGRKVDAVRVASSILNLGHAEGRAVSTAREILEKAR